MSRDQNLAAQQQLGELVNAGAFDRLGEVFAPDVADHDPAPDQGPGPEQVAIAYRLSATHQGEFQGVPATGRRVEVRGMQIARFRDGKIVERWGATDRLGILQQVGAEVSA